MTHPQGQEPTGNPEEKKWVKIFHTQNTRRGVEDMRFSPSQGSCGGRVALSALPANMSVDV